MYMFNLYQFPREIAIEGKRVGIVYNRQQLDDFIKKNIDKNIFTTVYAFKEVNKSKINYRSAIVDKVFFDFDYNENENLIKNVEVLLDYCVKNELVFSMNFSGRGIHFYIYTTSVDLNNPKYALLNFVYFLKQKIDLKIDNSVCGDLARETRLLKSKNFRSGLYVIPLSENDLKKGYDALKIQAQKQQKLTKQHLRGKKLLNLKDFDGGINVINNDKRLPKTQITASNLNIDPDFEYSIYKNALKNIKCLAQIVNKEVKGGYAERTLILSYLKNHNCSLETAKKIINNDIERQEKHKNGSRCFDYHAINFYRYDYKLPSCDYLILNDLCPFKNAKKECKFYNKLSESLFQ